MSNFKKNFAKPIDAGSFESKGAGVTTGKDDLLVFGVAGLQGSSDTAREPYICVYYGDGITLANYNAFETGTIIIDTQAFKIHMKTDATTWKSSAAMS